MADAWWLWLEVNVGDVKGLACISVSEMEAAGETEVRLAAAAWKDEMEGKEGNRSRIQKHRDAARQVGQGRDACVALPCTWACLSCDPPIYIFMTTHAAGCDGEVSCERAH